MLSSRDPRRLTGFETLNRDTFEERLLRTVDGPLAQIVPFTLEVLMRLSRDNILRTLASQRGLS